MIGRFQQQVAAVARPIAGAYLVAWVCLAAILPSSAANAEESPSDTDNEPIRFRRVFVPAREIPNLDGVYLPVRRGEFEDLLARINAKNSSTSLHAGARVVDARYTARLVGNRLSRGTATLQIRHQADSAAVVPLKPCGVAIGAVQWQADGEPVDDPTSNPAARVGFDKQGRMVALVDQSGELSFSWSLRGKKNPLGEVHFDLALPSCPVNQLTLDIADGMRPMVDHGVVTQLPDADPNDGIQSWSIAMVSRKAVQLRVVHWQPSRAPQQLALLRQINTVRIAASGADVRSELRLDIYNEPLSQLTLIMEKPLRLASVTYRDDGLHWTEKENTKNQKKIVVEFPEPIVGSGHLVRLRTMMPVSKEQSWQLPRVRAENVLWQEGTYKLQIVEPLQLKQLTTKDCRQTKTSLLTAEERGEAVELQCYSQDATAAISVGRSRGEILVNYGVSASLAETQSQVALVADYSSTNVSSFQLDMAVPETWSIESIETQPSDALEDWQRAGDGPDTQTIRLDLRKPLAADSRLRVVLTAKFRGVSSGDVLGQDLFRPIRFPNAHFARGLVSIGVGAPFQMRFRGDADVTRFATDELSEEELQRISPASGGLVFRDNVAAAPLQISITGDPPNYAADIQARATVDDNSLLGQYRIRCVPNGSNVRELLVRFSERRDEAVQWECIANDAVDISAELLTADEQHRAGIDGGQTWRIVLPRPFDEPFQLLAHCVSRFESEVTIPLASLPNASSQSGELTISAPEAASVDIRQQNLRQVPSTVAAPGRYPAEIANFRYEPLHGGRVTLLRKSDSQSNSAGWVWLTRMESRRGEDGRAVHTVNYFLENHGESHIELTPPDDCEILQVALDLQPLTLVSDSTTQKNLRVPLEPGVRFPRVTLQYATYSEPLAAISQVTVPWPTVTGFRELDRDWLVWLPPGYQAVQPASSAVAPSWRQRLFGPLLRPSHVDRFDPTSPLRWWKSRSLSLDPSIQKARRHADLLLRGLAEFLNESLASADDDPVRWAALLQTVEQNMFAASAAPKLLVDHAALAQIGIHPFSDCPLDSLETNRHHWKDSRTRAVEFLKRFDLAVVAHPRWLLVTSADQMKLWDNRLEIRRDQVVSEDGVVGELVQGDDLTVFSSGQELPRFVSIAAWSASPSIPQICWTASPDAGHADVPVGWTLRRVKVSSSGSDEATILRVHYPKMLRAYGWFVFVAATGLIWWLTRTRRKWCGAAIVICGAAAMLTPEPYTPLATGGFLGTMAAAAIVLFVPRITHRPAEDAASTVTGLSIVALEAGVVLLAVAATWAWTSPVNGQEPPDNEISAKDPIHVVLCPIDDQQEPEGDYYYLPRSFFDRLHQRAATGKSIAQDWLIRSANYHAAFDWDLPSNDLAVSSLTAEFVLDVFRGPTQVRLPLLKEQAILLPSRVRLDGKPATIEWTPDGTALLIEVEDAGRFPLELGFRPQTTTAAGRVEFTMQIPPIARSTLRLTAPPDATDFEFPTAHGEQRRGEAGNQRSVALGPTERLAVSWSPRPDFDRSMSNREVGQLVWVKVQPGAVVLESQFTFSTLSGDIRQVEIQADPRLQLLPPDAKQPIDQYHVRRGDTQTVFLTLREPAGQKVTVRLKFLLDGVTGVGNVTVPRIDAVADRVARRWFAASVSPDLIREFSAIDEDNHLEPAEFARMWDGAEDLPEVAFRFPRDETGLWSITTQPRATACGASQQTAFSFAEESAAFVYRADVTVDGGPVFQHRLAVPADVNVTAVHVYHESNNRVARWSRRNDGTVVAMFDRAITDEHRVLVQGDMKVPESRRVRLPDIRLQNAELLDDKWVVYRRPSVRLKLNDPKGFESTESLSQSHRPGWGRKVADLRRSDPNKKSSLVVTVNRNRPISTGQVVTTLRREDDSWYADVVYRLQIQQGIVDVLRLDVPVEWSGPYALDADVDLSIEEAVGKNRRWLVIRPPAAISGDFRLEISGKLLAAPGGGRVPDVIPLDVQYAERYLVTPKFLQGQRIEWETSGLQPAELPPAVGNPAPDRFETYRAVGPRYRATIREVQLESGEPRVTLADIHVRRGADGHLYGVATFDLEPAELTECTLQMPDRCIPVRISVANVRGRAFPLEDNRWRVRLGPTRLPQRVEVVYFHRIGASESVSFSAPVLESIPVQRWLWTIDGISPTALNSRLLATRAKPYELDLVRLQNAVQRVRLVADVVAESGTEDLTNWFVPWSRRFNVARANIELRRPNARVIPSTFWEQARVSYQRQTEMVTRLGIESLQRKTAGQSALVSEASSVWWQTGHGDRSVLCWSSTEALKGLKISTHEPRQQDMAVSVFALSLLVIVGSSIWLMEMHADLHNTLSRRPVTILLIAGLIWWLCFTASAIGFAIMTVAAVFSVWQTVSRTVAAYRVSSH